MRPSKIIWRQIIGRLALLINMPQVFYVKLRLSSVLNQYNFRKNIDLITNKSNCSSTAPLRYKQFRYKHFVGKIPPLRSPPVRHGISSR